MLRGGEWDPSSLNENPPVVKLLEAIGVARLDLMREIVEDDSARAAVDNVLIEMMARTRGNINDLNHAIEYIKALEDDEDLPHVLAERQEQRRRVHENQHLGQQVEKLVAKNLRQAGFKVEETGKGSDFEIWEDTEDIITLEIKSPDNQSWLVEVKSTRYQSVHMSSKQAETAMEKRGKFLLCVVPIPENTAPDLEGVRVNIRFIKNIGSRVAPLWENRNSLEELREDIISDVSSGVKLVCESGTAGIRVNHSVWKTEGFPLEELAEHLK